MLLVAALGCRSSKADTQTIVLYGFSTVEEVVKEGIIPAFQMHWKRTTGQDVDVKVLTSFAGSGTITNQIIFGAPAHIAIVATELDALNIKNAGLVTTDWREFNDQGTFAYSTTVILTRKGNPKGLFFFEDLAREGVEVVYPDPTTSGGAQWAVLALYGSSLKAGELADRWTGQRQRSEPCEAREYERRQLSRIGQKGSNPIWVGLRRRSPHL